MKKDKKTSNLDDYKRTLDENGTLDSKTKRLLINSSRDGAFGDLVYKYTSISFDLCSSISNSVIKILKPHAWFSSGVFVSEFDVEMLKEILINNTDVITDTKLKDLFSLEKEQVIEKFAQIKDINNDATIASLREAITKSNISITDKIRISYGLDSNLYNQIYYHDAGNVKFVNYDVYKSFVRTCVALSAAAFRVFGILSIYYVPWHTMSAAGNPYTVALLYVATEAITVLSSMTLPMLGLTLFGSSVLVAAAYYKYGSNFTKLISSLFGGTTFYHILGLLYKSSINVLSGSYKMLKRLKDNIVSLTFEKALEETFDDDGTVVRTKFDQGTFIVTVSLSSSGYEMFQARKLYDLAVKLMVRNRYRAREYLNIGKINSNIASCCSYIVSLEYKKSLLEEFLKQNKNENDIADVKNRISSIESILNSLNVRFELMINLLEFDEVSNKAQASEIKNVINFQTDNPVLKSFYNEIIRDSIKLNKVFLAENIYSIIAPIFASISEDTSYVSIQIHDVIKILKESDDEYADYSLSRWRMILYNSVKKKISSRVECYDVVKIALLVAAEYVKFDEFLAYTYLKEKDINLVFNVPCLPICFAFFDKNRPWLTKDELDKYNKGSTNVSYIFEAFFHNNALKISKKSFMYGIEDLLCMEPLHNGFTYDFSSTPPKVVASSNENYENSFKFKNQKVEFKNTKFYSVVKDIKYRMLLCFYDINLKEFILKNLEHLTSAIKFKSRLNLKYNLLNYKCLNWVLNDIVDVACIDAMHDFEMEVKRLKQSRAHDFKAINESINKVHLSLKPLKYFTSSAEIARNNYEFGMDCINFSRKSNKGLINNLRLNSAETSIKRDFESQIKQIKADLRSAKYDNADDFSAVLKKIEELENIKLKVDKSTIENSVMVKLVNNPGSIYEVIKSNAKSNNDVYDEIIPGFDESEKSDLENLKEIVNDKKKCEEICKAALKFVKKSTEDGNFSSQNLKILEVIDEIIGSTKDTDLILKKYENEVLKEDLETKTENDKETQSKKKDDEDEDEDEDEDKDKDKSKESDKKPVQLKKPSEEISTNHLISVLALKNALTGFGDKNSVQILISNAREFENVDKDEEKPNPLDLTLTNKVGILYENDEIKINSVEKLKTVSEEAKEQSDKEAAIESYKKEIEIEVKRAEERAKHEANLNKSLRFYSGLVESEPSKSDEMVSFKDLKSSKSKKQDYDNNYPIFNVSERIRNIVYDSIKVEERKIKKVPQNFLDDIKITQFMFRNGYGPNDEVYLSKKTAYPIDNKTYKSNPNSTIPRVREINYINSDYKISRKPN